MKKIIFAGVILLVGCMSGRHTVTTRYPDGTVVVKETRYDRLGDQKLTGVELRSDPDGNLEVSFEKQQSDAKILTDVMTMGMKMFEAGMMAAK